MAFMTYENPDNDLEAKIQQKQIEIEKLKSHIEQGEQHVVKLKENLKDFDEIGRLVDGLYRKAKTLTEEHLRKYEKMPDSDEEQRRFEESSGKIEGIYTLIDKLETESGQIVDLIRDLEERIDREFNS
jgi:chromosome segregation ATPase